MTERPAAAPGSDEGSVRVVGTAHVSSDSVDEVERVIEEEQPDVVAVELDEGRYKQLQGETAEDLEAGDLLRGNTVYQFLAYWMLSYVQTRLGERFDIEPGADMLAAVETAEEHGFGVALVDRNIQTTIQRFWRRMTLLEKLKMMGSLALAMFGFAGDPEEEIDLDDLTDADVVTAMMEEFRRFSPGGAEALIDERDAYIGHHLVELREAGHDVVAVVGAGHREGIESYLDQPERLPPLSSLVGQASGRRFSPYKAFGYLVSLAVITFFVLLALSGVSQPLLLTVLGAWFLFNGAFAFGMAKLAGAHWTSAGAGGAVAWLTSVNPLLAPGWFAGYVELRYQAVNVADISTLNELLADEETPIRDLVGQMLDVPLFRLIAVVAMTNVGSFVATLLFPVVVLPLLGAEGYTADQITRLMIQGAENGADIVWGSLT